MDQIIASFIANSPTAGAIIFVVWIMIKSAEKTQDSYLNLIKQDLKDQSDAVIRLTEALEEHIDIHREEITGLKELISSFKSMSKGSSHG